MLGQEGRLTAIAVRLKDPARLRAVLERFRELPGTQVVTMTEMMGTFLRLLGTVRSLTVALSLVACAVGGLGIVNTLLAAVVERAPELCLMRAVGASRRQVMGLLMWESLAMTTVGLLVGVLVALLLGRLTEPVLQPLLPLAPLDNLLEWRLDRVGQCLGAGLLGAVLAALVPAIHAGRLAPADAVKPE